MKSSNNSQKFDKNKIIEIFNKRKNNSFEEITKTLKVSGSSKAKLKILLDKMVNEGILYYDERNKVYTSFENSNLLKGTLFCNNNKYYIKTEKEKIYIKEEYLNNATIGDEVIIEYNSRKKDYIVKKVLKSDDKTYVGEIKFKGNTCYVINDELGKLEVLNPIDVVDGHIVTFKKIYGNIIIEDIICHKNEANSDIMKIVYKHDFIASISDKIKKELDNIPDYLTNSDIEKFLDMGAVDLRDIDYITIDCDDTMDMDDGVNIRKLDNGDMYLSVVISPASYYAYNGSSLSGRIRREGTSIYPPGCVIPMLPPKLSNGICSLNEGADRLVVCIDTIYDKNGNYKDINTYLGIINSKKKCKYSEVNRILEDGQTIESYKKFNKQLLLMQKLYLLLEKEFKENGFIEFDVPEVKISVDENYKLSNIEKISQKTAEKIIEFFMLTTNKRLTEYMTELGLNLIYRVDEEPDQEKLQSTIQFLKDRKVISIDKTKDYDQFDLQEIVKQLRNIQNKTQREIYNKLLIKSLPKAYYTAYNKGHYPIGFDYYATFTSPIRRGPDWRNKMILISYLINGDVEYTNKKFPKEMLEKESKVYSERERAAMQVESECKDMIVSNFVFDNLNDISNVPFTGYVSGISKQNLYITLENGISGKIPIYLLEDKLKETTRYTLKTNSNTYSIGDEIKVKMVNVDYKYNEIIFNEINKKNKVRSRIKNG